jgi:hypothetical protein
LSKTSSRRSLKYNPTLAAKCQYLENTLSIVKMYL